MANLKKLFEAKAAELQAQNGILNKHSSVQSAMDGTNGLAYRRELRAPELLSIRDKKHLFERKIRESRRWSEELDQARVAAKEATAARRATTRL